jgi:hypothetical protein
MDVRLIESTPDYAFATWGRLVMCVWRGQTTLKAIERSEVELRAFRAGQSEPSLLMTIVAETARLPDFEGRVLLSKILKQFSGQIERSAVVIEGDGFRALSSRAVATGVTLFSRTPYPHRVFATVGTAARFLVGGRHGSPAPHLVIRAVRDARRQRATEGYAPWLTEVGKPSTPDGPARRS